MPESQLTIVQRSLARLLDEMRWLECAVTKKDVEEIKERANWCSSEWTTDQLYQQFMKFLVMVAEQKETSAERSEEIYQQFTCGESTDD